MDGEKAAKLKAVIEKLKPIKYELISSYDEGYIGKKVYNVYYGDGTVKKCEQITMGSDKKTYIVPNVHEFPGHIACSSASNSEIVVPIIKDEKVVAVIDLDSTLYNNYSEDTRLILEEISKLLCELF